MSQEPAHKLFEQQIERIHRLLEGEGAKITWNDRIPDPDNPVQSRQIDIIIRRGSSTTIVECRFHKEPQDVTWIEELIGRRASLRADAVIAVSSSGFTSTARIKAQNFGVFVREFAELSPEEILNWGKRRKVSVSFCEFTNATIRFHVAGSHFSKNPELTADGGGPVHSSAWRSLL